MKINKKLHSVAMVSIALVLFLIMISSMASASITETKIITNVTIWDSPVIFGNRIVWNEEHNNDGIDVYMYDLLTGKKSQITTSGQAYTPAIYGNKIVWQDLRDGRNIYMYDLSTKKETQIPTENFVEAPKIYGNKIVWDGSGICVYDISTSKENQITNKRAFYPSIYGNIVVWWDNRNENSKWDIYAYDLSTHKETRITNSGSAESPDVYGNKIVWDDKRNGNWDIYIYDISTKKETQITKNSADSEDPVIYGNTIAWLEDRNGKEIYAYDLKTHQQIHTIDKLYPTSLSIYGNKIVWSGHNSNGNPNIYMGTISYLPVAAFFASPTTGKHPLMVKFTDKSTDVYYWSWNFGDKTTSATQSPTHKYTKAGKYTVKLTVKNAAGSNTKTMVITVK